MCGICLIIGGLKIQEHHFEFNFFESYLCSNTSPLNEHIIQNKLTLSQSINPIHVANQLSKRGPDATVLHTIDLFKTNYKQTNLKSMRSQYLPEEGEALGCQSILHLRGEDYYIPETPGSYFLFNGQIWDAGSLSGFDKDNNDAQWFHEVLMQCKGSREKMLEALKQIRGDFAFILLQGDQLFIGKDYYGKRSLLLGMGKNYIALSSIPTQNIRNNLEENIQQKQKQKEDVEQQTVSWKAKYQAEWLSGKNKNFFEIPANSLINIQLKKNATVWHHSKINDIQLRGIHKELHFSNEAIKGCVKKLLIQSIKQITRCIIHLGQKQTEEKKAKVAVLFSGGIDSTLIVRMLDLVIPDNQEIDLINLAFRQDAPDRQAGKISYQQLKMLNPHRKYNFIPIDHTLKDVQKIQKQLVSTIYPKTTHMDFNIATALNLASNVQPKIIMTGLGADEIFGGYSRYRIAYKRAGFQQMETQMIFDMQRLWIRNLGRDDRAISSRGKQVRYPFLYWPLWNFLRTVEVNKISEGNGQKMLLRKIAKEFGLQKASTFKKRAIQFGTRLAKLSNVKCFGSNRKARGNYQYQ